MTNLRSILLVAALVLIAAIGVRTADPLLNGAVTSVSGQKLEGVTVSARQAGSTITTTVYTDESGNYYFPTLPAGKYDVWAQALGFERARNTVDLTTGRQNFVLQSITDPERRFRQLPGELMVAALPEAAESDARMKKVFMNNCTGCHASSYILQFRFDEAGWSKIINLMKVVPVTGVYPGPNKKPTRILDYNQKELASYLARARGPGETSMKFVARPRPTGEAARAVWKLYDLPLNPDAGIGTKYAENDGTDWALGSTSKLGQMPHDGGMGLDGTLYYTINNENTSGSIGRVDTKTGQVSYLKVDSEEGTAANSHGLTRDAKGNFWFDINTGRRGLGMLDTTTQKITVYQTPKDIVPLGGAVTMDVDGKGKIWASAADGAIRFDPVTQQFTAFKSLTPYQNPKGTAVTYGTAGDRSGNGWWAVMAMDAVGHADVATGKVTEIHLPPVIPEMDRVRPEDREAYETVNDLLFNTAYPWAQGPRRMGTDKNADVLWVANSWGSSLARIDTKTSEVTIVPMPEPAMQPYHIAVDSKHNVWGNLWTSDRIFRLDPATKKVTAFDLPVRGTEIRHISLMERDGKVNVVMPVYRTSQMGVMNVRSEAELSALKAKVK